MAKLDIQLKGVQALGNILQKYSKGVSDNINRELARASIAIQKTAREEVPVDEGRLRSSIRFTINKAKHEALVGTNVEYAPYVEFGTGPHYPPITPILAWVKRVLGLRKGEAFGAARAIQKKIAQRGTAAQPFLEPAFRENRPKFIKNVKIEVRKANPGGAS